MTARPEATSPPPAGGREAIDWEAVLAQHGRWLRAVILARVGELEAVEEVMQEVALAAVRQAAPLQDRSKVVPWLYRLAVLQSLLYRRKCARQRQMRARYAQRCASDNGREEPPDPLAWLIAKERERALAEALQRLAPRDAEILLLKYAQQWNYHQIAEHLGISHAAVETRLHRARARLRKELAMLDPGSEVDNVQARPPRENAAVSP
jgi:RNA polymerase sigma factor (sigma-70 family)